MVTVNERRRALLRRTPTGQQLTQREKELFSLVAEGLVHKEIAYVLNVSHETVKSHVKHVLAKLGVNTTAGAVATLIRKGTI